MRAILSAIRTIGVLAPLMLAEALPAGAAHGAGDLAWPEKPVIVGMLLDRDFARLETTLTAYQSAYEREEISERWPTTAFRSFEYADPALEQLFEEWIARFPESYAAPLARGVYFTHLGRICGCIAYSDGAAHGRSAEMRAYFGRASADLAQALERDRGLILAYATLMEIAMGTGDDERERRWRKAALEIAPNSREIHWTYLTMLRRNWSATLRQVSAYVDEVLARFPDDPELRFLRGYPDYLVARNFSRNGKYRKALRYFDRALAIEENAFYLVGRGDHYFDFGRYELAIADYERALELSPYDMDALIGLAYLDFSDQDPADNPFGEAYTDRALELDPYDPKLLQIKAHYIKLANEHMDAAIPYLERATVYGGNDHEVLASLGRAYRYSEVVEDREWNAENMARAAAAYRRASELQPENQEYLLMYILSLGASGRCGLLEPFEEYARLCLASGDCTEESLELQRANVEHHREHNKCEQAESP